MLTHLTVERAESPLAIATDRPLFAWRVPEGERQSAYELIVRDGARRMWSSGRVDGERCFDVVYSGEPLASDSDYDWSVTIWLASGEVLSGASVFGTALLRAGEMASDWVVPEQLSTVIERYTIPQIIAGEADPAEPPINRLRPPQQVRSTFSLDARPVRARLFATARGVYTAHVNGRPVGDQVLAPGFDAYASRTAVHCYDVTALLREGANALGFTVADGWYAGRVGMSGSSAPFGDELAVLWHLSVDSPDGGHRIIRSGDTEARSARGGWDYSDLFIGERYDASRATNGWSCPSYDDGAWAVCGTKPAESNRLFASSDAPVKRTHEWECNARERGGAWVVDAGQVIAGRLRIRVEAPRGTMITIEHSEVLSPDGEFFDNIMGPNKDQRNVYVASGDGIEEFEPSFAFHGFRYARLTADGPWRLDAAAAVVIASDLPVISSFHTSDPRLDRLHDNIVWSQRGNFLSIPTDCPQRERVGWTGDVQVFAPSATNNMDVRAFLERWLANVRADQLPDGSVPTVVPAVPSHTPPPEEDVRGAAGWGDAIVVVPWTLYQRCGDERVLRENFDAMNAWVEYQQREAEDHLPERLANANLSEAARARHRTMWNSGWQFGDWLAPSIVREGPDPVEMAKPDLSSEIITAMYHARSTELVARIADVLEEAERADELRERAVRITDAFADEYVSAEGALPVALQGHYVLALAFGLIPEQHRSAALRTLVRLIREAGNHLDTGFLSTPHLLDVLWENGERDIARRILFQDTAPSWLYALTHDATTIWESWEAVLPDGTPTLSSMNHYAFGCIDDWLIRKIGGIESAAPGFGEIRIAPDVDGPLTWARTCVETVRGPVTVHWHRDGDNVDLAVVVPSGARAHIHVGDVRAHVETGMHRFVCAVEQVL